MPDYSFLRTYLSSDVPMDDRSLVEEALRIATEKPVDLGRVRIRANLYHISFRDVRHGMYFDAYGSAEVSFASLEGPIQSPFVTVLAKDLGPDLRSYANELFRGIVRTVASYDRFLEIVRSKNSFGVFEDLFDSMGSRFLLGTGGTPDAEFVIRNLELFSNVARMCETDGGVFLKSILPRVEELVRARPDLADVYEEKDFVLVRYVKRDETYIMYDKRMGKVVPADDEVQERYRMYMKIRNVQR